MGEEGGGKIIRFWEPKRAQIFPHKSSLKYPSDKTLHWWCFHITLEAAPQNRIPPWPLNTVKRVGEFVLKSFDPPITHPLIWLPLRSTDGRRKETFCLAVGWFFRNEIKMNPYSSSRLEFLNSWTVIFSKLSTHAWNFSFFPKHDEVCLHQY